VYKAYFEAFPGVANYFKKVQRETLRRGYILINEVTKRKFYIDNFKDFQKLRDKLYKDDFWERLSKEREAESALYFQYYKPLSKKYSKTRKAIERKALNYPIQATSAEITKLAAYFIFEEIYEQKMMFSVLMCNLVHDELLLEAPEHLSEWVAKTTTENMIRAGKILGCKRVPLKADAKIVDWWDH